MTVWTETAPGQWSEDKFARSLSRARAAHEQRDFAGPWGNPYATGVIPPNWMAEDGTPTIGASESAALANVTVMACISLLADTIMQLPIDSFRGRRSNKQEIDPPSLIAEPNPEMFDFDYWHRTAESLVGGNTVQKILDVDRHGFPTSLLPIHTEDVTARRNAKTGRREFVLRGSYARAPEVLYADGNEREIVHIPAFTVPGQIMGVSRVGKARLAIQTAQAAEGHGASWFRDAANPSSVLETDQTLAPGAAQDVQKQWITSHGGRRLPAVLGSGYKWRAISITPEESQFLATQKWGVTQIARLYRVPPHLVGDVEKSTSWGSGIEEQNLGFLVFALNPYIVRLERAFSSLLPKPQFIKFNVEGLLRARTLERYESYVHARNAGWMNVDEIRDKEDLPPIPDGTGRTYIQPLNMGPLGIDPTKSKPTPAPEGAPA